MISRCISKSRSSLTSSGTSEALTRKLSASNRSTLLEDTRRMSASLTQSGASAPTPMRKTVPYEPNIPFKSPLTLNKFASFLQNLGIELEGEEVNRIWRQVSQGKDTLTSSQFEDTVSKCAYLKNIFSRLSLRNELNQARVRPDYDFTNPTDYNYSIERPWNALGPGDPEFIGKNIDIRQMRDPAYHVTYSHQRQLWQDDVVEVTVSKTMSVARPWLLLSAGPMGAGKGHAMRWLSGKGFLPLETVCRIDPDNIKHLMPEWPSYVKAGDTTAGSMCHIESGYIAEMCVEVAFRRKQNVLVDGSLRNWEWQQTFLQDVRDRFPEYRIGIFYVYASKETVKRRCEKRFQETGRYIPSDRMAAALVGPGQAILKLTPLVDLIVTINNDVDGQDPTLVSMQDVDRSGSLQKLSKKFALGEGSSFGKFFPSVFPSVNVIPFWDEARDAPLDINYELNIGLDELNPSMLTIQGMRFFATPWCALDAEKLKSALAPEESNAICFLHPRRGQDKIFGSSNRSCFLGSVLYMRRSENATLKIIKMVNLMFDPSLKTSESMSSVNSYVDADHSSSRGAIVFGQGESVDEDSFPVKKIGLPEVSDAPESDHSSLMRWQPVHLEVLKERQAVKSAFVLPNESVTNEGGLLIYMGPGNPLNFFPIMV